MNDADERGSVVNDLTNYPDLLFSCYGYSLRKYVIGLVISLLLNVSVFMSVCRVSVTFIATMAMAIVKCLLQYTCVRQCFLPFILTTPKHILDDNSVSTFLMHDITVLL